MAKLVVILLLSFFLPYLIGLLSESRMGERGAFSIDKVQKLLLIYLLVIIALKSRFMIPRHFLKYLGLALVYLFILFTHYLFTDGNPSIMLHARNEVIRLTGFIIIFFMCAITKFDSGSLRFLLRCLGVFGFFLGFSMIRHSLAGEVGQSQVYYAYGQSFLRGGTGVISPPYFAAIANIASVAAIAGFLVERKWLYKTFFLLTFAVSQSGRFLTFSSGGLISFVLSMVAVLFLLNRYDKKTYRVFLKVSLAMVSIFSVVILTTELKDILFYRLLLSDEHVMRSSVYSRLDQYMGLWEIFRASPWKVLYGIGTAELKSSLGMELHNAYLRPLAVAGIGGFLAFITLYWLAFKNFNHAIKQGGDDRIHFLTSLFFFAGFIGWSFQAAFSGAADTTAITWFFFMTAYILKERVVDITPNPVLKQRICR